MWLTFLKVETGILDNIVKYNGISGSGGVCIVLGDTIRLNGDEKREYIL